MGVFSPQCPTLQLHGLWLPGSWIQARILEWVSICYSRRSFLTHGWNPPLLCLLHWQEDSLPAALPGKSRKPAQGARHAQQGCRWPAVAAAHKVRRGRRSPGRPTDPPGSQGGLFHASPDLATGEQGWGHWPLPSRLANVCFTSYGNDFIWPSRLTKGWRKFKKRIFQRTENCTC